MSIEAIKEVKEEYEEEKENDDELTQKKLEFLILVIIAKLLI